MIESDIRTLMFAIAIKDALWPLLPIVAIDVETGEIVYVNKYSASVFGYRIEELIGQQIEKLVPPPYRDGHVLWRKNLVAARFHLMGMGRRVHGIRKSGDVFPASVTLSSVEVEGRTYGVVLIVDLTGIVEGSKQEFETGVESRNAASNHTGDQAGVM